MGGFKQSGIGRRHGPSGLLKYTELQTVVVQRLLPVTQLPFGGGERYQQIMGRAAKLLRRSGIP
jgi:succinate-semialdehyde dehydrogenase/glutarate-semialdehyde dehydrogenase